MSEIEQEKIKQKIDFNIPIFFSYIEYDDKIYSENDSKNVSEIKLNDKLLIAGIAKPETFFQYLENEDDISLQFPDHHNFSELDIKSIIYSSMNNMIVTTEKDYVRLKRWNLNNIYYLPIKSSFILNNESFDDEIFKYINL